MQLAYPIVHILFYLVMLFAPPGVERVSISGPDESFELTRSAGLWKFASKELSGTASSKEGNAILTVNGTPSAIPAASFVAAAIGHDWTKQSKVTLKDQNTLEKTADGFVLRTDDGKPGMKEYRIKFHQSAGKTAGLSSINVLGAVKQPGIYQIENGALIPTVIEAAGGLTEKVDRVECRILRGEGGAVPKIIEVPSEAILNRAANGPKLEAHDTVYVPSKEDASDATTGKNRRMAEMKNILLAITGYFETHQSVWPKQLEDVRALFPNLKDNEFKSLQNPYSYHPCTGVPAAATAILFEKNSVTNDGQFVGFSDGHIEFIKDLARLGSLKGQAVSSIAIHITVAADGALTVADQPCPADQLAERLGKLANNDALSVVVHADEKVPFQQVQTILDSCKAAGIKESALRLATP